MTALPSTVLLSITAPPAWKLLPSRFCFHTYIAQPHRFVSLHLRILGQRHVRKVNIPGLITRPEPDPACLHSRVRGWQIMSGALYLSMGMSAGDTVYMPAYYILSEHACCA